MIEVTFGASGLDRAAELRDDQAEMERRLAQGHTLLPLWRGKPAMVGPEDDRRPLWLSRDHPICAHAEEGPVFLGLDGAQARFALDVSGWEPDEGEMPQAGFADPTVQAHPGFPEGAGFVELRSQLMTLGARDAELLAVARAVLGWNRSHRFCAACGQQSRSAQAGWQRVCDACGGRHFPRTDPVVIVLATHGNDVLLGRSPGWPEGMYSLLAGFVEPGETLEAAAAREVFEEAGIRLGPVRYLACQPWPFPSSLMVGMAAEAESREITLDPVELEDAIWVSREAVLASLSGNNPELKPARKGSIARSLIEEWLAGRAS